MVIYTSTTVLHLLSTDWQLPTVLDIIHLHLEKIKGYHSINLSKRVGDMMSKLETCSEGTRDVIPWVSVGAGHGGGMKCIGQYVLSSMVDATSGIVMVTEQNR